jgi:hypothetical protein
LCGDTKDFVQAANLFGSQTYLAACKTQLQNTGLNFDSIDYGFLIDDGKNHALGKRLQIAGFVCLGLGVPLLAVYGAGVLLLIPSIPLLIFAYRNL